MTNKEIGLRIQAARQRANLNKKELAEKIKVADSTIKRYEDGEIKKIKMPIIESIAHATNVNPMWIIGKSESMEIVNYTPEKSTVLTYKDECDIKKDLESIMEKLQNGESGPAAYDGEEIPEADRELFAGQIELMLRRLKTINKEKYNPNKNKSR